LDNAGTMPAAGGIMVRLLELRKSEISIEAGRRAMGMTPSQGCDEEIQISGGSTRRVASDNNSQRG